MGVIYGLRDPDTMELRYVGQTKHAASHRLKGHMTSAEAVRAGRIKNPSKANAWLASLSGPPVQTIFEENVPDGDLMYRERYWIKSMFDAGHRLVNGNPGGGPGHRWSDEQRARHKETMKGKGSAGGQATAAKLRGQPGRPHDESSRAKLRAARRHQVFPEACCTKCQRVFKVTGLKAHLQSCVLGGHPRKGKKSNHGEDCSCSFCREPRRGAMMRWHGTEKGGENIA